MMVQANLNLNAAQIIARIQASATAFPATPATGGICHVAALTQDATGAYTDVQSNDCQCTTATCGAGMLNAAAALGQAVLPQASLLTSTDRASVGQSITLDGSASTAASGHTLVAWQWSTNPSIAILNPTSEVAKILFPSLRPLAVSLTVTDDLGRTDTATKTIDSVSISAGDTTSGAGAFPVWAIALLAAVLFASRLGFGHRPARPPDAGASGSNSDRN
jgi:serine protease